MGNGAQYVSFTIEILCIPYKELNRLALIKDTLALEIILTRRAVSKYIWHSGLGDARAVGGGGFHFTVKVDFQGERRGVENRTAILAATEVPLDFARDFRGQPTFQIFAD